MDTRVSYHVLYVRLNKAGCFRGHFSVSIKIYLGKYVLA